MLSFLLTSILLIAQGQGGESGSRRILAAAGDSADGGIDAAGDRANGLPRTLRPPSATCRKAETAIRFQKPETEGDAGLAFATVTTEPLPRVIVRTAEIAYNANRYARLSSRVAGVVVEVRKDLGAKCIRGDVLAVVDSVELGAGKADLLQTVETLKLAERNLQREQGMVQSGVGVERELREAETKFAEIRIGLARTLQRLRYLGLSTEQIDSVEKTSDTSSLLELTAPFDGVVVERSAVVGEVAASGVPLLAISDTDSMWAMIDLQTSDLRAVQVGQSVSVTLDGLDGETFAGLVTWVSTHLDPKTRTIKARAELENRDGLLRASMFGRARITTRAAAPATMVPKDAVQWDGCCNIVFVKKTGESATYQPQQVRLAYGTDDRFEVLSGVDSGDMVVTRGSFLLKTEILKDSIGAGCCDVVENLAK